MTEKLSFFYAINHSGYVRAEQSICCQIMIYFSDCNVLIKLFSQYRWTWGAYIYFAAFDVFIHRSVSGVIRIKHYFVQMRLQWSWQRQLMIRRGRETAAQAEVSPGKAWRAAAWWRKAQKNPLTAFAVFQVNALSVGSSKDSTDSVPLTNNVYEEPPGNGAGDSGDEGTYQTPPSNKPVHEAPPSTLYLVSS